MAREVRVVYFPSSAGPSRIICLNSLKSMKPLLSCNKHTNHATNGASFRVHPPWLRCLIFLSSSHLFTVSACVASFRFAWLWC